MNPEHYEHLAYIQRRNNQDVQEKYEAGVKEHGGFLPDKGVMFQLREGIKEVNDLETYLYTLEMLMSNWECKRCGSNYVNNEMLCWEHSGGVSSGR